MLICCSACGGRPEPIPVAEITVQEAPRSQAQAMLRDLSAPHPMIRLRAAKALEKMGPAAKPFLAALRAAMARESDALLRRELEAVLRRLDSPHSAPDT